MSSEEMSARHERDLPRLGQSPARALAGDFVGLPDGDGFAVVDWLREHERLVAVPIVVYTRSRPDRGRARTARTADRRLSQGVTLARRLRSPGSRPARAHDSPTRGRPAMPGLGWGS